MFNLKSQTPPNISKLMSILNSSISNLRHKPKNYFLTYLTFIFTDLLIKSNIFKESNTLNSTNYSTTINLTIFHYYFNFPFYISKTLYNIFSPMTFNNFIKLIHTIYFGNTESSLRLCYGICNINNSNITINDIKSVLYHFHFNSTTNTDNFEALINNIVSNTFGDLSSNKEISYNKWKDICTKRNSDVFTLMLFYLYRRVSIFNEDLLNYSNKLKPSFQIDTTIFNTIPWDSNVNDNTVSSTSNTTLPSASLNNKEIVIDVDTSKDVFNLIKITQGMNIEYIDNGDSLSANSYDDDLQTLTMFEEDKRRMLSNLNKECMKLPIEPIDKLQTITPKFHIGDTIIANVKFKMTQSLILPNEQHKLLTMPQENLLPSHNKVYIYKYECFTYENVTLTKVKLYIIHSEIFVLTEDKTIMNIISLTSNWGNNTLVFGKDNIKIKDAKYFKIKLYQTYEFYFLDRKKGKEMNRVVCKKLNVQSMMPQGNTNTIIKGKYEIDLNNPICELYNKKLKLYKTKDIYDIVSTKSSKELYVKILSKDLEGINVNMEHYYFEFMKQLVTMNNKNGIDFGIKPYDKYESISALYFIYVINNDVYEKVNSMFTKLMLMKAISHFVYYMNICNICLNISQIAFSCNSFKSFIVNSLLTNITMKFMSDDIKYSGLSGKSVNHCPPEVLKSELRNKDNDVWWLGNVFYYVMYNKLPPCVDKINNELSYNNNTKEENQIKKLINNMLCVDIKNIINIENVFNTINGIIENYFK